MDISAGINNFTTQKSSAIVELEATTVDLNMSMYGYTPDGFAPHVGFVSLKELIPFPTEKFKKQLISDLMLNDFTTSINKVPGNRIFLYTITNYLTSFDRLQFYYLHKHNFTEYSELLLSNINTLALDRGSLLQKAVDLCKDSNVICKSYDELYNKALENFDHQLNYTSADIIAKNPNGLGFFANNLDFFFYELPGSILIYILMYFAFKTLFNYRISKFFRKYSFSGIILLIIYEGKVEQFSFYFFSECRNLFSRTFSHKLAHVFMLFFFFILIVFCVGGLVWLRFHYKKFIKYFMEDWNIFVIKAIFFEIVNVRSFP